MNGDNHLTASPGAAHGGAPGRRPESRGGGAWLWVNWCLALGTVPAAAIVMLFALGAAMSADGCGDASCSGRTGIDFGVAFYGAPAVAVVVIAISFGTAGRRGGVGVPLLGWALLIADVALMAASVAG